MRFSFVPFVLLAVPLSEIAVFVAVGSQIGVLATIGLVIATAVLGAILLRVQGFGLLARIQQEMRADRVPGRELVHGVMILVAGVLLLTPGFITDTLGFLLFVPAIRDAGWRFLRSRITVVAAPFGMGGGTVRRPPDGRGPVIDLDEDDFRREPDPRSPWRP